MDTTEQYIKMCEKAEEIQEDRLIQFGDYFTYKISDIVFSPKDDDTIGNYYKPRLWHDTLGIKFGRIAVWLPRQDQLQEMVGIGKIHPPFLELQKWHDWAWETAPSHYYDSFTSMEQLWLAFVMCEKYNKVWNGETWI